MRHPLITPLASRDGSVNKDEKLVNCYGEQDDETKETFVFKRAGTDEGDAVISGPDIYGQGLFNYGGYLFAIIGDILTQWIYVGGAMPGGGTYYGFGGTVTWSGSDTYDIGDTVVEDGIVYYSYSHNNIGNNPNGSPLWGTTAPGANTYQGSIYWGGTGEVCSSVAAAGYSAYLACPYDSCANRRLNTNQWLTYDSMSGNNIRCHAYGVFSPNYCSGSINDFGVGTYGTVTKL